MIAVVVVGLWSKVQGLIEDDGSLLALAFFGFQDRVDFKRRQIHLPKTKNGDPRTVPLDSIALAALKELDGSGRKMKPMPVFPSVRTGESLQGSRGWFTSALEEAKIEGYTWHCNRHTFASRLVMAGVDLRTVAEQLGHRTLQMVMRYSHLAPEHQTSAVDRLVKREIERTSKRTPGVLRRKRSCTR
jgi:integrase